MTLDQILVAAENKMRSGERAEARRLLLLLKDHTKGKINGHSLNRAKRSKAASLARRAGLLPLALQLMSPIVRPKTPISPPATDEELATYGLILLNLGAIEECDRILETANQLHPEILIAKAFSKIRSWNYSKAIEYLESYTAQPALTPYQKMTALVNLAASFVAIGDLKRGRSLIENILTETEQQGWSLLHRNSMELLAQTAVQEEHFDEARKILEKMTATEDDLFIQKWLTIANLKESPESRSSQDSILKLKNRATELNHWETVRDCDYHLALARQDNPLMLKVYFGTPFKSFRDRIRHSTSEWLTIPRTHSMTMTGTPAPPRVFDLRQASEIQQSDVRLPKERVLHKTIKTLTSDLYRPFPVGSIHSSVYAGEQFNFSSSPQRVAFLIHRLRAWLDESGIPLDILNNRDGYRLSSSDAFGFQYWDQGPEFPATDAPNSNRLYEEWLESLSHLRESDFSAHDVAKQLKIAERTARYFLKWAIEANLLMRVGSGRGIRYRFSQTDCPA